MEDVGRVPTELTSSNTEPATIPTLDGWIESLMQCKQLAESDVQRLCEKVRLGSDASFTPPLRARHGVAVPSLAPRPLARPPLRRLTGPGCPPRSALCALPP
jgi:hypothetical protein